MTIKELIEKLKSYPPEVRVLVDGYEGGFSENQIQLLEKGVSAEQMDVGI